MKIEGINKRAKSNGQRGFTLVELVVVIAILGVLAAIAVPLVTNYLGGAKERAWFADRDRIQAAVDAYYSAPNNVRFLGQRQYPIKGMDASTGNLNTWTATDAGTGASPENPLRGTSGGDPKWRDSGDGIRTSTDENLNLEANALNPGAEPVQSATGAGTFGWYVVQVTRQGTLYAVDSRNYFIDFDKLTQTTTATATGATATSFLNSVPKSASTDNIGGSVVGSYSWYVDAQGKVNSLYFHFPTNGQTTSPVPGATAVTINNGLPNRGFKSGVYP